MFRNKYSVLLLLVVAMLFVGCSELADFQIQFDSLTILEYGDEVDLTAVGKTKFNMGADLETVAWSVSDSLIATIDADGLQAKLKAVGEGVVTVTAAFEEMSDSATFTVVSGIPDPVVFHESFEDMVEGEYPAGWVVKNQDTHDNNDYSGGRVSAERASSGKKAVKLVSIPESEGRITIDFAEPLLYHTLTVDIFQVGEYNENINLELLSDEGRVFGVFVTATGNVRFRHPDGGNGSNVTAVGNDCWHTIEFQWNDADKIYKAFAISGSQRVEVTPPGGSSYELEYIDGQVTKFSAAITQRDGDKVFFIDNITVVDRAVEEMLAQY